MSEEAKQVTCGKCGTVMMIPPQYANTAGRCRKCGATVNEQSFVLPVVDLADLSPPPARKAPAVVKQKTEPFGKALVRAMLMGLAGAAVAGTLMDIYFIFRRPEGQLLSPGTLFANANTGLVLGFTLCSLYVFVKHLNWGPFRAAAAGLIICGVTGTVMYLLEASLVAPPDMGLQMEIVMVSLAGGMAGLVLGAKLNSD